MTPIRFACLCMAAVTDVRVDDLQEPADLGFGYRLAPPDAELSIESWRDDVGRFEIDAMTNCTAWVWVQDSEFSDLHQKIGYFETGLLLTRAPLIHGAWVLEGPIGPEGTRRVASFGRALQTFIKEPAFPLTTETLGRAAVTANHLARAFKEKVLSGRLERGFVSLLLGMRMRHVEESILFLMRALEGLLHADNARQFVARGEKVLGNADAGLLEELYRVRNKFTHVEPFTVAFPDRPEEEALIRARQLQAFLYHFATRAYREVLRRPDAARTLSNERVGDYWGRVTTARAASPFVVDVEDSLWKFAHDETRYLVEPVTETDGKA
jgi:hypothetical protein